jgi:thiosulfate/3-mercaptopyruvate sulfurtransferase
MNTRPLVHSVFILALLCAAFNQAAAQKKAAPAVRSKMLVTTAWLAKQLNNPKVVILHVAAERKHYDNGHLPGARFLSTKTILTTRNGVANELPPAADLQNVFEQLGIGNEARIVIYGENAGLVAARVYFTLDYLGHGDRAALLDGGLEKWKVEQREVSTTAVTPASAPFTPHIHPSVKVEFTAVRDLAWTAAQQAAPNTALLDARPAKQFTGEDAGGLARSGHLPGAVSLYWMQHLVSPENPTLKPVAELRKLFAEAGVQPDQTVVTYCRSGMQASHSYFTAKYLGYDVKLYDGSFGEWVSVEGTEVIKGKEKK